MNDIPKGFQKTEVGVIPSDWVLFSIEKLTPENKQYTIVDGPFGSNLKTVHYRKSGIPIITSGYVTDGKFLAKDYLYVDLEKFKQEKRSAVRGGDIVMAKIGERCGASAILPENHQEAILSGNALKITIDENKFSKELISQILWQHHIKGNFEILRTTGAQPAISMANLKKYKIPLPPTKAEQTIIATALNDADKLITELEKLIAKKRNIKQGAMQELLRPKKGWVVKKLEEVLRVRHGKSQKEVVDENGQYPILASGGTIGKAKAYLYNKPSVLIGRKGTIDEPQYMDTPFWSVDTLFYTEAFDGNNAKFIFYMFCLIDWYSYNEASGVPSLNAKTIELIERYFPKEEKEQTRIAQILFDMDAEIDALEKKLEKYKMLKQGMMQNLLTGKIRLV
ncbi:MAG: restriction endonuclease subunit S [Candidatus Kuenenia sp.]|nr:restriction endonuclease subunit S [Candidatus Kuenenia hertensis]